MTLIQIGLERNVEGRTLAWALDHPGVFTYGADDAEALLLMPREILKFESWLKIVKLLPVDENSEIVLSTLYIDEANLLVRKAITTTKENGTYEMALTYGKYSNLGLPDKVVFSFNTKDYKLPKGITLEFDDGQKATDMDKLKNKKGRVEIVYTTYIINKGIDDKVFK